MPVNVSNAGLLRSYIVRDLSPYTMYSFKIRVYNTLASGLSGEQLLRTKATSKEILLYMLQMCYSKKKLSCCVIAHASLSLLFTDTPNLCPYPPLSKLYSVHTTPSRKRNLPPEGFENVGSVCVLVWTKNILKTELFKNDEVTIIMLFHCPRFNQTHMQNGQRLLRF